jgi:hypothetical protein
MLSQRQLDANRRNAQFSTGPRTPEGRAVVGLNALRHGLSAQITVLPNENPEEFQELLDAFLAEYQPAGPTETLLVEQMAMASWRLRRMRALETGLFSIRMSQLSRDEKSPDLDPRSRAFAYDASGSRSIESLSRYETRIERSFYRALHELDRLRAATPATEDPPPPETDFANQSTLVQISSEKGGEDPDTVEAFPDKDAATEKESFANDQSIKHFQSTPAAVPPRRIRVAGETASSRAPRARVYVLGPAGGYAVLSVGTGAFAA